MAENERYDIAYLEDIEGVVTAPSSVVQGNIAVFGEAGDHASLQDSGKKLSDYVAKTELPEEVDSATEEIWNAVRGVYAISAYNAPAWEPEHAYAEGDFCKVGGIGYRCTQNHTSSDDFDDDKDESWKVALTASGKLAIDAMLRVYSKDGLAKLSSLAPAMVEGSSYSKDQLVVIDGDLYICTTGGIGGSTARFRKATVEESIVNRIQALSNALSTHTSNTSIHVSAADRTAWDGKQDAISDIATIRENAAAGAAAAGRDKVVIDTSAGNSVSAVKADGSVSVELAPKSSVPTKTSQLQNDSDFVTEEDIPTKTSQLQNDSGFVKSTDLSDKADAESISSPYDSSEGYQVGNTCTHEGRLYVCIRTVAADSPWDDADWRESTVTGLMDSGSSKLQSDWNETDTTSPRYIRNKPAIDDTLSIAGAIADAKAVGDALDDVVTDDKLPYKVQDILYDPSASDATNISFGLLDRTVNIIDDVAVSGNMTMHLLLPSPAGQGLSRDFYVVMHVSSTQARDIPVSVDGASLSDFTGSEVNIYAPSGQWVTYRFTETSDYGNVFLVSGFGDPTYRKIREIEQALDDLLADGGAASFVPGIFIPDASGKFHKLIAVTDPETGEVDIGVEQEGVEK